MTAKKDASAKIYDEMGFKLSQGTNVNKYLKAMVLNFGDERGDIIVKNDNFGTRRKYADFTNGKKEAGLHPLQIVFTDLEFAKAMKDKYVGADDKIHVFGE